MEMNDSATWKRGRRRLGILQPQFARWKAQANSDTAEEACVREFRGSWRTPMSS